MKYEVRGVLAGAYKGGRASLKNLRTHAVETTDAGRDVRVLCGGVPLDHMADYEEGSLPTCPRCAAKLDRLISKAIGTRMAHPKPEAR